MVKKGKVHLLKKHALALSVSIFVHLVLILLLFCMAEQQQPKQVKNTHKSIKSYLYQKPPKPITVNEVTVEPVAVKKTPEEIKITEDSKVEKKSAVREQENINQAAIKKESSPQLNDVGNDSSSPKNKVASTKAPVQATFSSYKQLDNLRNSINKKMLEQGASELQQFRSPSVMHGKQIPVPHSSIQLTPEQEREQKTTRMSDDISITKYDNGLCIIEREQFLGSPVEGSVSGFACGESKFDQSFRAHMKKVQKKILPKK